MTTLVDQPTAAPSRKWAYGAAVGLLTLVAQQFWGAEVPPIAEELIPLLAGLAGVYFTRERDAGVTNPNAEILDTMRTEIRNALAGATVKLAGGCTARPERCTKDAGHDGPHTWEPGA